MEGHILYASLNDGTDSIVRQIDTDNIGGGWSNYTNVVSSRVIKGIFNVTLRLTLLFTQVSCGKKSAYCVHKDTSSKVNPSPGYWEINSSIEGFITVIFPLMRSLLNASC